MRVSVLLRSRPEHDLVELGAVELGWYGVDFK